MSELSAKLESMTAGEVWEVMKSLVLETSDHATVVYETAMDVMETKVSEEKFVEICEKLEDIMEAA